MVVGAGVEGSEGKSVSLKCRGEGGRGSGSGEGKGRAGAPYTAEGERGKAARRGVASRAGEGRSGNCTSWERLCGGNVSVFVLLLCKSEVMRQTRTRGRKSVGRT